MNIIDIEVQIGEEADGLAVDLGILYSDMNKFEKAIQFHREGLALRETILGANDGRVAASLRLLAGVYTDQGNYEQANLFFNVPWISQKEIRA